MGRSFWVVLCRAMTAERPRILHLTMDHAADDVRVYEEVVHALAAVYGGVMLASPAAWDSMWAQRSADAVTWRELPWCRSPVWLWRNWQAATTVVRSLEDPLVIHVHETESAIAAWWLGWCDCGQLIYDAHECYATLRSHQVSGWKRWIIRRFSGLLDRLASRVAGRMSTVNEELRDFCACRGARVSIVTNACQDVQASALSSDRRPGRVGYVGGLHRARGLGTLMDAVDRLLREGSSVELDLAGKVLDDRIGARIEAMTSLWPDRVRFHGRLRHGAVLSLLGETSVGVVPFHRMGFYQGRLVKVLEYAMMGNALVVTDHGPKAFFVREHEYGAVVSPDDVEALTTALRARIVDGALTRAEGDRARAAAGGLSWDAVDRKVLLGEYAEVMRDSA